MLVEKGVERIADMPIKGIREDIKIDRNHLELIYGLVVSAKPKRLLEFGMGCAAATDRILDAIKYNEGHDCYTVVDNWIDFGGKAPREAVERYAKRLNLVTRDEGDFIRLHIGLGYDFILSDADHFKSEKYMEDCYMKLLNHNGILIYHDVCGPEFPNLHQIIKNAEQWNLRHAVFNKNSRSDEHCDRGLIVIFKT